MLGLSLVLCSIGAAIFTVTLVSGMINTRAFTSLITIGVALFAIGIVFMIYAVKSGDTAFLELIVQVQKSITPVKPIGWQIPIS